MDTQDDFVVYLNSKANLDEYPRNRAGAFTNILNPNIVLNNEYEIGLQNIIFNPRYDVALPGDPDYSIRLFIEFLDANNQSFSGTGFTYYTAINISGDSKYLAIQSLNNDFHDSMIHNRIIDTSHKTIFKLNLRSGTVTFNNLKPPRDSQHKSYRTKWMFSKGVADLLGVSNNNSHTPLFIRPSKLPNIEQIFINSDVITPSRLGDQSIHILDILPTKNIYAKNTTSTLYKPNVHNVINDISIKISSNLGKEIAFNPEVTLLVILHFRLRR